MKGSERRDFLSGQLEQPHRPYSFRALRGLAAIEKEIGSFHHHRLLESKSRTSEPTVNVPKSRIDPRPINENESDKAEFKLANIESCA